MNFQQHAVQAIEELRTIEDMVRWSVSRMSEAGLYYGHGSESPADDALMLVSHALSLPWAMAEQWYAARLTRLERESVIGLVEVRIEQRMPVPYITGVSWYCGRPYFVDERVLIPRSPIGELIENRFAPWWPEDKEPERILDLCTGSGCIGIACAHEFADAAVELLDISFEALEVAEANIQEHNMADRVVALQSDLFTAASGKYDLIISNPPYVDADDMSCLPEEYHHEPELALAAGEDGLDLVRIMLSQVRDYLTDDGVFVLEVGNSFPALAAAYPELPFIWPEFERGGHGVCVLHARDLDALNRGL
ncbi:50S ribosomal protein L3 N(5)-glutamine methyltransferase [uncultured Thalassolituus sp.]|uniref:50S ribosomal protein L3 N(5)-glutamine methyltransferase n=1 Tax=Thalassolituus sp. TaxID=2030822 RepID=UPI0026370072|nr:50S ribosomal protein L3 N(5)-glutamine methyltransferase [uncultured Thalassolituus sp.]